MLDYSYNPIMNGKMP